MSPQGADAEFEHCGHRVRTLRKKGQELEKNNDDQKRKNKATEAPAKQTAGSCGHRTETATKRWWHEKERRLIMGVYIGFVVIGIPCILFLLYCLTPQGKHWLRMNGML